MNNLQDLESSIKAQFQEIVNAEIDKFKEWEGVICSDKQIKTLKENLFNAMAEEL